MARVYVNNYSSSLSAAITDSATTIYVSSATGLPTLTGSDYYYLTISNVTTQEIVKVTARSGTTLTVVRAQESTTGVAWAAGNPIDMRFTAASIVDWTGATGNLYTSGYVAAGTTYSQTTLAGSTITSFLHANSDTKANAEIQSHSSTAGNGSLLYLGRSRGTSASKTVVSSGDTLGSIQAIGYDGTDYAIAASIDFSVGATPGSNDMPGEMTFSTSADGAQTPLITLKLTYDQAVQVGGGTAASELRFMEASGNGTNYTGFKAPASLAGNVIYTLPSADGTSGYQLTTNGSGTLSWAAAASFTAFTSNVDVAGYSLVSSSNGNILITPNGTGKIVLDGLSWPTADGSAGQILTTDGAGNLSFSAGGGGGGLANVVDDTTPQLGGDLDVNGKIITSVSAGDIIIKPDTTGVIKIGGNSTGPTAVQFLEDSDNGTNYVALKAASTLGANTTFVLPTADGSANQVIKTDGSGNLGWATPAGMAVDVQTFTASGTWTKPSGATTVLVVCYGAGGGGGAGASLASATVAKGGGGGGGGCRTQAWFTAGLLSATETVTIGNGGTAGTPGAAGAAGGDGGVGGTTDFGGKLYAYGGGGGRGGAISGIGTGGGGGASFANPGITAAGTAAGVGGAPTVTTDAFGPQSVSGGANSTATSINAEYGGAGGGGSSSTALTGAGGGSVYGGAGGGSGGCHTATPAISAGKAGGTNAWAVGNGGAVGTDGSSPTAGGNGAAGNIQHGGAGGGGGGTTVTASTNGGAGGNGGAAGGGAGGGGVGMNPGLGGAGGTGGSGACYVISW